MANQGGDVRASLVGPQVSATASASGLKLPLLLTARPGNVGVQIDCHRTMNLFSHPRSVKFTSQFHGIMFENGSLENYSRVVERTAQRARLLQDKLEKLRAREQYLLEDEAKRIQRRVQREAARQRRMWQMHQAAKRADERAREAAAAVAVQKVIRGALARRVTRVLRQARATNEAASMLQRTMKTYVGRQQLVREHECRAREEEERQELEMHSAAAVLQRQACKRLHVIRQQAALAACAEDDEDEDNRPIPKVSEQSSLEGALLSDEKIIADALSRGISLDLLFSDEEDGESALATNSTSSSSIAPTENKLPLADLEMIRPQPPASNATTVRRPRRPMFIKRVGGGYRTKLLPYKSIDSSPAKEATTNTTTRAYRGRTRLRESRALSSSINDGFLRHPHRSPRIPKAALSPPLLASKHTRPSPTSSKSDADEIRTASPTKASTISPYAIPQRLPPSR